MRLRSFVATRLQAGTHFRMCAVSIGLLFAHCSFISPTCAETDRAKVSPADAEFFEKQIRPILAARCQQCHGEKKQEFGLRLDTRDGLDKGSDSGPAIVRGKPEESPLIEAVGWDSGIKMPPAGKMPPAEIAALTEWVKRGAPWPETPAVAAQSIDAAAKRHWAFQPIARPQIPDVQAIDWSRTPIDRFILTRLEKAGISPAKEADKRTLLRRVSFDLIGLPPAPEETAAFLGDESPEAYERLVDRLLASPQYGERWARYWLDVARFADTKGYVFFEDAKYPWAWTYRDYVIRSFNDDLPYDQFLDEQLAADLIPGATPERLAAVGFLTAGGRFMNNQHDILDDRIDVVTRGVLGLTVGCARCHDHKFDPIPSADYYSLYGIFRSAREPLVPPLLSKPPETAEYRQFDYELWKRLNHMDLYVSQKFDELVQGGRKRAAEYLMAAHKQRLQPSTENFMLITDKGDLNPTMIVRWQKMLEESRKSGHPVWSAWHLFGQIDEQEAKRKPDEAAVPFAERAAEVIARLMTANGFTQPPNRLVQAMFVGRPAPQSMAEVAARYGELFADVDRQWTSLPAIAETPGVDLGGAIPSRLADEASEEVRLALYGPQAAPNLPRLLGWGFLSLLPDRASQEEFKKLLKEIENWAANGANAPPRVMSLQDDASPHNPRVFIRGNPNRPGNAVPRWAPEIAAPDRRAVTRGSGRRELAASLTAESNPLTARVLANRLWMHHFGTGIVATAGDFGLRSEPPSHPELLNWLASEFRGDGGRPRWSIKRLQRLIVTSSVYRQSSQADEPTIAKSRTIDPENRLLWRMNRQRLDFEALRDAVVSASGQLNSTIGGPSVTILTGFTPRRTLYGYLDRQDVPSLYRDFDFPDPAASSPQRETTTVPPQALFLMNNAFALEAANRLANRPDLLRLSQPKERLDRITQILFVRSATESELKFANDFLGPTPDPTDWTRLIQAFLLSNEFAFVD